MNRSKTSETSFGNQIPLMKTTSGFTFYSREQRNKRPRRFIATIGIGHGRIPAEKRRKTGSVLPGRGFGIAININKGIVGSILSQLSPDKEDLRSPCQ